MEENKIYEEISVNKTESEEIKKITEPTGIAVDNFDQDVPLPEQHAEDEEEFKAGTGIALTYTFNAEEIAQAMKIFQKKTLLKKNIFYSLIVAALFVVQLVSYTNDPNKTSLLICVVCVAVLFMIWQTPKNHIRQVQRAIASYETPQQYEMELFPGAVRTGKGEQGVLFRFDVDQVKVMECENLFVISFKNQSLFPVPKRCCEAQAEEMRALFKAHLGTNYEKID